MGIKTDEKTTSRTKEEGCDGNIDTRGNRDARHESKSSRHQQKRTNRADSKEPSIFISGTSVTGGMLRQLISDYRDQVAAKKRDIKRLNDEIQRLNEEAEKLENRIAEFEVLEQELEKQIQENPE